MERGNNMETYITICKIENQWNLLYDLGKSNRGSVITSRGGMEREAQERRNICIPMADSC